MAQIRCCWPGVVDVLPVRRRSAHLPAHLAHGGGAAVHQQDRCRVEPHRAHPCRELDDLLRVHALVGEDLALRRSRGQPGQVEGADEPTDGQPGVGVLVQVDGRHLVTGGQSALLPGLQTLRHATVGSREGAGGRRVPDPSRRQRQSPERRELERAGDVRRDRGATGLHRCIVGATSKELDGGRPRGRAPCDVLRPRDVRPRRRGVPRRPRGGPRGGEHRRLPPGWHAHRVHHQQRLPDPRGGGRAAARARCRRRRPTTSSPPPRPRRGCCSTSTARAPGSRCWGRTVCWRRCARRGWSRCRWATDDAVAIVTGYAPEVRWKTIMRAAVEIRNGLPWVATNTDPTLPTGDGPAPGHGTLVKMISGFAGVRPEVAGKPERPLFDETLRRVGGDRPLMVGDSLHTDIAGAHHAGTDSLLVMTGVTVAVRPGGGPSRPAADLGGAATCGRWVAPAARRPRSTAGGRPADGRRRCTAAGSWSTAPETRTAGGRWSARQPGRTSTRPARRPTCRTCPLPVRTPPRGSLRP